MKHFYLICAFAVIACLFLSCKHSTDADSGENAFATYFPLKYEKICTAPTSGQSMMLTCYSNKILIYSCYGLMLYDTTAKSWLRTTFPIDTIKGRWDGALSKFGNSLYVFGAPGFLAPKYYKVVKMDITTLEIDTIPEPLPISQYEAYPAYAETDSKLLIVYPRSNSVYLFDSETQKGTFVAQNIIKVNLSDPCSMVSYAFGKYGNYLYIYEKTGCVLKRINLSSFTWESIDIPQEVKQTLATHTNSSGAIFDGLLVLYVGTLNQAICYDIASNKWGHSNYDIGNSGWFESRYTTDNSLYILNRSEPPATVWRVTRIK